MSYTADQILSFALDFERTTSESLVKSAKKKEEKKSKKPAKKEDKASSDKNKADVKEKDSKKKKPLPKKKSFITQFDNLIAKFAQAANPVLGNLGTARSSLNGMLAKLKDLKADPGSYPPGNIDAAIDQINNALQQLGQAEREATKGLASEQLNYYLTEIGKYYGYAKNYIKPNPGIWDTALDETLSGATTNAKTLNAPPPAAATPGKTPDAVAKKPAAPARPRYPSIPENVQLALNMMGFKGKDGRPLSTDGSLGPNTRFALEAYKAKYPKTADFSDQNLFSAIEYRKSNPDFDKAPEQVAKTPQQKIDEEVDDVFGPRPKPPVATWATPPAAAPATPQQVASNTKKVPKNDPGY